MKNMGRTKEDECVVVRMKGGLGNQLFQYSFAKYLESNGLNVKLDYSACYRSAVAHGKPRIKELMISLEEATSEEIKKVCMFKHEYRFSTLKYRTSVFFEKTFNKFYYFEKGSEYHEFDTLVNKKYFDGYWQNWRYPTAVLDVLLEELKPISEFGIKTKHVMSMILEQESVFVGIRKGDYASSKANIKKYGSFSNDYYLRAMSIIRNKRPNAVFYIFTNDVDWCKRNLKFGDFNVVFR